MEATSFRASSHCGYMKQAGPGKKAPTQWNFAKIIFQITSNARNMNLRLQCQVAFFLLVNL